MSEFIQKCPHCSAKLQMQTDWNGMDAVCPFCKNKLVVCCQAQITTGDIFKIIVYSLGIVFCILLFYGLFNHSELTWGTVWRGVIGFGWCLLYLTGKLLETIEEIKNK